VGREQRQQDDMIARARNAETAHLEAVLKVNGAKALRLAHLADRIMAHGNVSFSAAPGTEPQIWLGVTHRILMEPDASTYRLTRHGTEQIETILETSDLDAMVVSAQLVLAHLQVRDERAVASNASKPVFRGATLFYVWLTGVVTGGAALALYLIYLKRITF
jgi:hypothetical protein